MVELDVQVVQIAENGLRSLQFGRLGHPAPLPHPHHQKKSTTIPSTFVSRQPPGTIDDKLSCNHFVYYPPTVGDTTMEVTASNSELGSDLEPDVPELGWYVDTLQARELDSLSSLVKSLIVHPDVGAVIYTFLTSKPKRPKK